VHFCSRRRSPAVAGAGVRTPSEARRPEVGRVGPGDGVPPVAAD